MAGYPQGAKYRKLFAAFGVAQRRQFWSATGIDIGKESLTQEKFDAFKNAFAEYREYLAKSGGLSSGKAVEGRGDVVCDSCGQPDEHEIYFSVPKCAHFCMQCTQDLIKDAESS